MSQARSSITTLTLLWALSSACKPAGDAADLKVTNGQTTSDYPEVVQLDLDGGALCTGTFVSDTTLLTAAHCLKGGVAVGGVKALKVFRNPKYGGQVDAWDTGVALFPPGTGKKTASLLGRSPRQGEAVTIVGFGLNDMIAKTGAGTKRLGRNKIAAVEQGMVFFDGAATAGEGNGEGSSAALGDSGGPETRRSRSFATPRRLSLHRRARRRSPPRASTATARKSRWCRRKSR